MGDDTQDNTPEDPEDAQVRRALKLVAAELNTIPEEKQSDALLLLAGMLISIAVETFPDDVRLFKLRVFAFKLLFLPRVSALAEEGDETDETI